MSASTACSVPEGVLGAPCGRSRVHRRPGRSAASTRRRGATDRSTAFVVAAAFGAGGSNAELRPQTFAFILFALTLALLLEDDPRAFEARLLRAPPPRPLGERSRVSPPRGCDRRTLRPDLSVSGSPTFRIVGTRAPEPLWP